MRLRRARAARRPSRWLALLLAVLVQQPVAGAPTACNALAGKTLRWIVPNSAGGGYDAVSRLLQPHLEQRLRATIIIDNRSEAGGIVGAVAIRDAPPDGRTLGIINASGLIAASLDSRAPDPATDFTILARLLSNQTVALTGANSGIGSLDDLLSLAERRPIVIAVRDAGSASLFMVPVVTSLLGIDYELVTGYVGNTARVLAAIRGEVDLLMQNLDSVQRFIDNGELRPLLQITGQPPPGIPALVGAGGVAERRAVQLGRSREQALQQAGALATVMTAGRLVVTAPGLPAELRACLEAEIRSMLGSSALREDADRAGLSLEPADAATAGADVLAATAAVRAFAPMVRAAMQKARQ